MKTKFLTGKPEWKRSLGRTKRRLEDNINECEDDVYILLAQEEILFGALIKTALSLGVP